MFIPLSYNLRSLFVRRSASFLTVLGIGATVAIVSGVIALQQGFKTMFVSGGREDVAIFLRPGASNEGDSQFSRERGLTLMKRVPEIAQGPSGPIAGMEAYLAVLLPRVGGDPTVDQTNVPMRGVQPMTFEIRREELRVIEGSNFTPGSDELIVGSRLVGRIENCNLGDVLTLNKTPFRVVGVFEHPGQFGGEIWGDLDRLMAAMGRYGPNRVIAKMVPDVEVGAANPVAAFQNEEPEVSAEKIVSSATIPWYGRLPFISKQAKWKTRREEARATINRLLEGRTDWRELIDTPRDELATELALGAKSSTVAEQIQASLIEARKVLDPKPGSLAERLLKDPEVPAKVFSEKQYLESQTAFLSFTLIVLGAVLGLIMGIAAVFTATNTMLSAIAARTHEIGVLLAMGYRPVPIFLSFMFEALLLGLIGGLIGCVLALPFNGVRAGTTNFQTFTEMAFAFRVTPVVLVTAIVFSLILGMLGGAWPAWRAARMRPTDALRHG